MEKKALVIASMASMIDNFNRPSIGILQSLGYEITVAASFGAEDSNSQEKNKAFYIEMESKGCKVRDISFSRSLTNISKQIDSYRQVKKLLEERFDLVHCHSPICSVITRSCYQHYRNKYNGKIVYTAHGFHFYKGAPLKNWVLFYPIEKWLSRYTDVLVTINKEDYKRATEKFHAKKTVYVPGMGVDIVKFHPGQEGRERLRTELGLPNDRLMILSVGELNENKNHEAVIRAITGMEATYVVVGKGERSGRLENAAKESNVDLRLMGFRSDVADFYRAADVYVLPSIREGLNVSLMEAMACGLPCAASRIRGNTDLIDEMLFDPKNPAEICATIERAALNGETERQRNLQKIQKFDLQSVNNRIERIYRGLA